MTYSTLTEIAARVPRYVQDGQFTETTRPTESQVNTFVAQVSATLDAALSSVGFITPITASAVTPMCDLFVADEVAKMIAALNGHERRNDSANGDRAFVSTLESRAYKWAQNHAVGLENMGAARSKRRGVGSGAFRKADSYSVKYDALQTRELGGDYG